MNKTATFLIDVDRLFLDGLDRLLDGSQFEVTHKFASVDEATAAIKSGTQAELILVGSPPRTRRIVVLISDTQRGLVGECLNNSSVDSVLHRDMTADALIRSVSLVMDGAWIIPTRVAQLLMQQGESGTAGSHNHGLSDREMEILRCLVNGDPNKVIARALGITEATVKVHLKNLLKKIGVTNRTQAAVWALKNGIGEDSLDHAVDSEKTGYSVAA